MGAILCSRRWNADEKIVVEVLMDKEEYLQLKGQMDGICLFSEHIATVPSKVSLRGRNDATKYFLVPRQLRRQLAVHGEITCQRIEHAGKSIFVYVLDAVKGGRASRVAVT
jgi:hypothetical protein